jgi:predicted AlkP superfamily pyrophosphatase or phosphodiesterase
MKDRGMRTVLQRVCLGVALWTSCLAGHAFLFPQLGLQVVPQIKNGTVMTRAQVLGDNGGPILVVTRTTGDGTSAQTDEIEEIGEIFPGGPLDNVYILSGAEVGYFLDKTARLRIERGETMKRAVFLDPEELASGIKVANGETSESVNLPDSVKTVLVLGERDRFGTDPSRWTLVEYPFLMAEEFTLQDSASSVLFDEEGEKLRTVLGTSDENGNYSVEQFTYRVGYWGDGEDAIEQDKEGSSPRGGDRIFGAVPGAELDMALSSSESGGDGRYQLFALHHCLGLQTASGFFPLAASTSASINLVLKASIYNPRGKTYIPMLMQRQTEFYCGTTNGIVENNFIVDVLWLSGKLRLANTANGDTLPMGDEVLYQSEDRQGEAMAQSSFDFDGDGEPDISVHANKKTETDDEGNSYVIPNQEGEPDSKRWQAVYFSSGSHRPDAESLPEQVPDLWRLADHSLDTKETGLYSQVTQEVLVNTDLYVFRESTGELIVELNGMPNGIGDGEDLTENGDYFSFNTVMRGPKQLSIASGLCKGQRGDDCLLRTLYDGSGDADRELLSNNGDEAYQLDAEQLGFQSRYQQRDGGLPAPGEWMYVVAINRTTGYTGTVRFQLGQPYSEGAIGANITQRVPDITLTPPNLKVWAKRVYDIEKGLTKDETVNYLIGHEGAATQNDTLVGIYTEWLDSDGRPLPAGLDIDQGKDFGLSGRLAKIAGDELVPVSSGVAVEAGDFDIEEAQQGSQIAEFPIGPGQRLQLLRLKADNTSNEHYYVNVFGRAVNKEACSHCEFDKADKQQDLLTGRPNHYTPFYVPRYDEVATLELELERNKLRVEEAEAQEDGEAPPDDEDKLGKVAAQYEWMLRPEYQFTLLDIEVDEINAIRKVENSDGSETETVRHLLDENIQPVITSSEDLVRVLYSLILPEDDMLQSLDVGIKQYVLSLGGEEVLITASETGQLEFENTRFLDYLDVEDFLLLSLYVANDEANLLWQWAFSTIDLVDEMDQSVGVSESISHVRPTVLLGRNDDFDAYQISDFSVQQGSPATVTFSLKGRVLCDIADVVEDGSANIDSVGVVIRDPALEGGFRVQTVSVSNVEENTVEQEEYLPNPEEPPIDSKHTFWGEFSETITMPVYGASETIVVEAANAVNNLGYASLVFNFDMAADEQGEVISVSLLSVDQPEPTERGLFLPVWAKITDGTIRSDEDLTKTRLDVRQQEGVLHTVPVVKNEDTELTYGSQPLLVVTKPLKEGVNAGNVVNVFDAQDNTLVAYYNVEDNKSAPADTLDASQASAKTKMTWGHVSEDSPPNYYSYAENTAVKIDWYSEVLNKPDFRIKKVNVYERVRNAPVPRRLGKGKVWEEDEDIDVVSDVSDSQGLVKDKRGSPIYGHRFAVKLNEGAREFAKKRLGIVFEYRDEEGRIVTDHAYAAHFNATSLKTIILAVDGFAYDSVKQVIDSTITYGEPGREELNAFAQIFKEGHTVNRDTPALSALPTITWANWPGVFGGGAPRDHGVLGNSFFRRDVSSDGPVFSGGKSLYEKVFQQAGVALMGRMNSLAKDDSGSIYDDIAEAMGRDENDALYAYSVRPFYTKHDGDLVNMSKTHFPPDPAAGKHSWEAAELLDDQSEEGWSYYTKQALEYVGELVSFHPYFWDGRANLKNLSVGAGPEAERTWNAANKDKLDVMSIYFPGPDNVGHSYGTLEDASVGAGSLWTDPSPTQAFDVINPVNGLAVQAENVTARGLSKLWARIRDDGYANAVMFALVADHGQHTYFGVDHRDEFISDAEAEEIDRRNALARIHNLYAEDVEALFERPVEDGGLGIPVWKRGEQLDDSTVIVKGVPYDVPGARVIFSGNGGLGQFYVRSDRAGWEDLPSDDDVRDVAKYLAKANVIKSRQLAVTSSGLNVPIQYREFDYTKGFESPKIAQKYLDVGTDSAGITRGAFGLPAAIFVRSDLHGYAYRWFDVQFERNGEGEILMEELEDSKGTPYFAPIVSGVDSRPIDDFLAARGNPDWPDFKQRMAEMNDVDRSGDIIVIMDGGKGYLALDNEGDSYPGWHGGPTVSESYVPLMVSMPGESFVEIQGDSASVTDAPVALFQGGDVPKENGSYLRNWELSRVLEAIHNEFRQP